MVKGNHIAREISYAHSASNPAGRALIRLLENSTGRLGLIERAAGYEREVAEGACFWTVMARRFGLSLEVTGGNLKSIPPKGPVIVIANHPYGILDGLMMGQLLAQTRGEFRILAHQIFRRAKDLEQVILPVSFDATREAQQTNLTTRRLALNYLGQGGAVGVFPGGTVSTGLRPFSHPMDPGWRGFTARMIAKSNATVVPVFFEGHTSRMFQIASHLHSNLRMGLLINEFRKRVDTQVKVAIGEPIDREMLAPLMKDTKAVMDFLRKATYELSPVPLKSCAYGFEFEEKHRA
ncbi:acyltransferase domain protein [Roseobacter sp. SK209-2-6]|uniref:lysophospholipid acyltransferase family protein n=1 Tax=Roseobacter sp. SK209-2-6 TaxID=388739 RepID=UPI0000F3F74A|nr:lysophospholipid acyltransferase family protein [Roseobacter sp. SK209-2-6]EBA18000.1 acyltransferase domain protein [Roseobacter sp. SK209-2-6]